MSAEVSVQEEEPSLRLSSCPLSFKDKEALFLLAEFSIENVKCHKFRFLKFRKCVIFSPHFTLLIYFTFAFALRANVSV